MENRMGGGCSTHGTDVKLYTFFGFSDVYSYNIFLSLASNPVMQNRMRFIMECDCFAEFILSHRQKVLKYNSKLFSLPHTRTFLYSEHNLL